MLQFAATLSLFVLLLVLLLSVILQILPDWWDWEFWGELTFPEYRWPQLCFRFYICLVGWLVWVLIYIYSLRISYIVFQSHSASDSLRSTSPLNSHNFVSSFIFSKCAESNHSVYILRHAAVHWNVVNLIEVASFKKNNSPIHSK